MKIYVSKGAAYFPAPGLNNNLADNRSAPLRSLQDFLAGRANYVSLSMDKNLNLPYGTSVRIPEIESRYGRSIEFRVVDTEASLSGKGYSRVNVYTRDQSSTFDPVINGSLTLRFG